MIERWFRSFKYEEAYLTQYNNIKEARAAIKRYVHTYNFERYHSTLDYHTPAEYYYPAMLMSYVAQLSVKKTSSSYVRLYRYSNLSTYPFIMKVLDFCLDN